MKVLINNVDVTEFAETITNSGDLQQPTRTTKIRFERIVLPEEGDSLVIIEGETVEFEGVVLYVDVDAETVDVEASDRGIYLSNNYCFKEYSGTPQTITKQVCAEFGIEVGTLASINATTKVISTGNMTAFAVIQEAYEGEGFTKNNQYSYYFEGSKFNVEKAGQRLVKSLKEEIISSERSFSIKNTVNQVVIMDDDKKVGVVEDAESIRKYGVLQAVYKVQEDKNSTVEAEKMLKGIEETGNCIALGDFVVRAGRAVEVDDYKSGLKGRQIVKSDKHTITSTGHEMSLDFYYEA